MSRIAPVMTRVTDATKKKLRALAENTQRSDAYLVNEAIENFIAANDWQVELVKQRAAEADAGGETLSHAEAMRRLAAREKKWLKSGEKSGKRRPKR